MSKPITRRSLLKYAGLGMSAALLASCGPDPTPVVEEIIKEVTREVEKEVIVEVEKEKEVTRVVKETVEVRPASTVAEITLAWYGGWWDYWYEKLIDMFNESHEDIRAVAQSAPWEMFWTRFEAQAAAGVAPALSIGDPGLNSRYIDRGIYLALEPLVERDAFDLSVLYKPLVDACRYDVFSGVGGRGTLYGLPMSGNSTVMYYNKDLFDAAGVPYPSPDWDRNDWFEMGVQLTRDVNGNRPTDPAFDQDNVEVTGLGWVTGGQMYADIWMNGGEFVSDDNKRCRCTEPEVAEIFEWYRDLIYKHRVMCWPGQFMGYDDLFLSQKFAMYGDGTWNIKYFCDNVEFNWDIAFLPMGTKGLPKTYISGPSSYHIYAQTKEWDAAWTFLKWWTEPEPQEWQIEIESPARKDMRSKWSAVGCPEHRGLVMDALEYGRIGYVNRGVEIWAPEVDAEWSTYNHPYDVNIPEMCQRMCDAMQPVLDSLEEW